MAPASASTIDTTGPYVDRIGDFGASYTPAYGQTFLVGSDNAINSFTFFLGGGAANVRAYLYAWNGQRAIGNAFYASDTRAFGGTIGSAFEALTFDVGAIDLNTGFRYVAFLTTAGLEQPWNAAAGWMPTAGDFGSDAYAGGDFVYTNGGNTMAAILTQNWDDSGGVLGDAQFLATFSQGVTPGPGFPGVVPEPASWAMLIGGVGMAGGVLRRRRRTSAPA